MNKAKRFAFLTVACGLFLASCGSDDGFSASIIGKWNKTSTTTTTGSSSPQTLNYEGNEPGCDKDYLEFANAGLLRDVALFKNAEEMCTEDVSDYTWERTGDIINVDYGTSSDQYTITKLTGSELRFESTGIVGGVTIKVSQHFRKK